MATKQFFQGRALANKNAKRQRGRIRVGQDFVTEEWNGEAVMEDLMNKITEHMHDELEGVRKDYAAKAPRLTGTLADSFSEPKGVRYGNSHVRMWIESTVPYLPFIEWGTEFISPDGTLRRSFARHKNSLRRSMKKLVGAK